MDLFADDVIITDIDTGAVIASNKDEMRPRYVARFGSPVHCELISRTVLDNVVIDREVITGLPGGEVADCIATYVCDVVGDKITRVSFVWRVRARGVGGDGDVVAAATATSTTAAGVEDDATIVDALRLKQ